MLIGLLGYPLTASLSPRMQNAAFAECGLDWSYALVPVREGYVEQAMAGLADSGFAGANVTTPHKLAVLDFCKTDLPSVNTLIVRDGRIEGHSTDAAILEGLPPNGRRFSATAAPRRPFAMRCRTQRSSLAAARGRPTCARPISSSTPHRSGTR